MTITPQEQRTLIEDCAKAIDWPFPHARNRNGQLIWNPLTNTADREMLVVGLGIEIKWYDEFICATVDENAMGVGDFATPEQKTEALALAICRAAQEYQRRKEKAE
jgi:hypothetical protein